MRTAIHALMLASALIASSAEARSPKVGEAAPNFTLTLMDGSKVTLSDLKGQVVMLNFWATWCTPCMDELPLLNGYYDQKKGFGLRFFAIEQRDEDSVPLAQMKPFLAKLAMPSARWINGPYKPLEAIPTNYVIDRNGVVRYAKAGAFNLDTLHALLVPLLKEPVPAAATTGAPVARTP